MVRLVYLQLVHNLGITHTLFGVLVLLHCVVLYACPSDSRCSCKHASLHCTGLSEIPASIPGDTVSITLMHGDIAALEPAKLQHLTQLASLQIIHNNVSYIQEGAFDNLTSLTDLSLWANNLASLPQQVFSNLRHLKQLTLSDNKLESLEGVLNGLMFLESLSVDNNRISHISTKTFHHLKNLHQLKLTQNNLQTISAGTFDNNKNMMILSLGSNAIGNIDGMIPLDTKLHYLNLTDCDLQRFPQDLPHSLQLLTLSKNKIKTIQVKDTIPYTQLTTLVLDENKLSFIETGAFTHMKHLQELFLFTNRLEAIPGPLPSSIQNLHLHNNKISAIPSGLFQEETQITLLSLRANKITSIDPAAFEKLTSIEKLELEMNPLRVLQDGMFSHATGLKQLSLSILHLEAIQADCFQGLHSLHKLTMSQVTILEEHVQGNFFRNIHFLEILDIGNSPTLASFILSNQEVLQSLQGLQKIDLQQNQLTTLSAKFPEFLPHLKKINLARNLFHCTSDILWLKNWQIIEPQKFVEFNQVRCHTPHEVQGQRLTDLEYWKFFLNDSSAIYDLQPDDFATPQSNDTVFSVYDDYSGWNDSYDIYDNDNFSIFGLNENLSTSTAVLDLTTTTVFTTPISPSSSPSPQGSLRAAGIAIGMALAVIVIMLLVAAVLYICLGHRRNGHPGNEYEGQEDYVFTVSRTDIPPEYNTAARMTREQRGSTTSRASEDITNHTDLNMKVYTLDVDA